jgi:hypothetical protein
MLISRMGFPLRPTAVLSFVPAQMDNAIFCNISSDYAIVLCQFYSLTVPVIPLHSLFSGSARPLNSEDLFPPLPDNIFSVWRYFLGENAVHTAVIN